MKQHEALNILAHAAMYEEFNLGRPEFSEAADGSIAVHFFATRPDHMAWGMQYFETADALTLYVAGMQAARREAAYDAEQAAKAQPAPAVAE